MTVIFFSVNSQLFDESAAYKGTPLTLQSRFSSIPIIKHANNIRCPNSLGSEKKGSEVMYVKTFRLL